MTNHIDQSSSGVSGGIVPILVQRIGQTTRLTFPTAMPNASGYSELFRRVFRVRRVVAEKLTTGVKLQRVCRPLYVERVTPQEQHLTVPVAIEQLVTQLCDTLGLPYTLVGQRLPRLSIATSANLVDLQMLETIAVNERLVVRHEHHAVDVAHLIGQVCLAFPMLKIIVLVKQSSEARRITQRLHDIGVEASLFTSATKTKQNYTRVAVATFQSAGHEAVGLWSREMVVVHDIADAVTESGRVPLRFAHVDNPLAPRVVGVAKADFVPSINQNVELLNVYGPVEVLIPASGAVVREVEYALLPIAGMNYTKGNGAGCSVGDAKRCFIWANPIRNRVVSRVARGFAEGDVESVGKRFPELTEYMSDGKQQSVLVVVENGLHACALLHHHLRGWEAIGVDIGVVPPSAPRWGWLADKPMPAVATFAGLKTLNIADYDVVVRADAGTGNVPISKNGLVTANSTLKPLLLLDFDDWRDPALASHTEQRRAAYDAAGWGSVDGCREHRELRRFLNQDPQGKKLRRQIEQMAKRIAAQNLAG